ncbi:unnamed protein product [Lepidochelys olivacea]
MMEASGTGPTRRDNPSGTRHTPSPPPSRSTGLPSKLQHLGALRAVRSDSASSATATYQRQGAPPGRLRPRSDPRSAGSAPAAAPLRPVRGARALAGGSRGRGAGEKGRCPECRCSAKPCPRHGRAGAQPVAVGQPRPRCRSQRRTAALRQAGLAESGPVARASWMAHAHCRRLVLSAQLNRIPPLHKKRRSPIERSQAAGLWCAHPLSTLTPRSARARSRSLTRARSLRAVSLAPARSVRSSVKRRQVPVSVFSPPPPDPRPRADASCKPAPAAGGEPAGAAAATRVEIPSYRPFCSQ